MKRFETLIELKFFNSSFPSSTFSIRAFRAYPFVLNLDNQLPVERFEASRAIRGSSISVSSTLPPHRCIYVSMYLMCPTYVTHVSIDLPIYLSTCLPIYLSTYLPIYLSTYLHIYISTYLPIYLSTYRPIDLSTYLPIHLSTYVSIYIPEPYLSAISTCPHTYDCIYIYIYIYT